MIVIDLPEARLEFPDGTPNEAIRGLIEQHATDPKLRASALSQWADQFVNSERSQGGVGQAVGDTVRNFARGTPVGSWLDEANAGTSAALNYATGGKMGAPYDEAVAYQRATDRAVDKAHPVLGTATKIAGGIASVPFSPVVWGASAGSALLPQVVRGALTGAAYGGAYGAGEGEGGIVSRGKEMLTGAGIGAGIGAAAPFVARGVSNAAGYIADKFKGAPQPLGQYSRGAVNRVTRAIGDDAIDNAAYRQQAAMLGPEGMLADMGPNLQSQAGAIANQPGAGQRTLTSALDTRRAAAPGRVSADVTGALGPRVNLVEAEEAIRKRYGEMADPLYKQFRQSPVPFTRDLETVQRTLQAQPGILQKARQFAALDGSIDPKQFFAQIADDGTVAIQRVPNASEWDYVKRALDDFARSAGPGTNEQRIYSSLATKTRDAIDSAISPSDPSASIYARARGVAGEGIGLRKAMEEGQGAFSKALSPDQMRADLTKMSQAERLAYALGARGQVGDIMGNSATAFGQNADSAARRALGSEFARDKLSLIADPDAAGRLVNRLDAETAFEKTRQGVLQNSATAKRLAAQAEFPGSVNAPSPDIGQKTVLGLVLQGAKKVADISLGGALSERNAKTAEDAAKILSSTDAGRDALAKALLSFKDSKAMTKQGQAAIEKLTRGLLRGSTQTVIDAGSQRR